MVVACLFCSSSWGPFPLVCGADPFGSLDGTTKFMDSAENISSLFFGNLRTAPHQPTDNLRIYSESQAAKF